MSQDLEILVICSDLTVARFRCYGLGWRSKYAGLLDVLNNLLTKHVERLWDWRSERDSFMMVFFDMNFELVCTVIDKYVE